MILPAGREIKMMNRSFVLLLLVSLALVLSIAVNAQAKTLSEVAAEQNYRDCVAHCEAYVQEKFPKGKFSASVNDEAAIQVYGTKREFSEFEKCMKLNGQDVDMLNKGQ
jgi:hypothetical protein